MGDACELQVADVGIAFCEVLTNHILVVRLSDNCLEEMSDNLQVTRQRGKNQVCSYIIYIYMCVLIIHIFFHIYFYYFYVCWSGWVQHLSPPHKGRPGRKEGKTSRIVQPRMPPMKYNIVVRNTSEILHNEHTRITHLEQTDLIFAGPVCIFGFYILLTLKSTTNVDKCPHMPTAS